VAPALGRIQVAGACACVQRALRAVTNPLPPHPSPPWSRQAVLRCLRWPGYFAFHTAATRLYGGVYCGDGLPNVDIAFMI
jgi:hypothetical protein